MGIFWITLALVVWFFLAARLYRKQRTVGMALLVAGCVLCLFVAGYVIGKARALEDNARMTTLVVPHTVQQEL